MLKESIPIIYKRLKMCGIIGIVSKDCIKNDLYIGLKMLQHRGQDAAT